MPIRILPYRPKGEGGVNNSAPVGASSFPLRGSASPRASLLLQLSMNGDTYSSRGKYPWPLYLIGSNFSRFWTSARLLCKCQLCSYMTATNLFQRDERRDRDRGDRTDRAERPERPDRPERTERPERGERRRSRSPHYGSRGAGRREQEANSYSSSRDYRAREREDRYTSGRRDDREWDRGDRGDRAERGDRGDRGDRRRRDFDDRPRRADLFEDRPRRGGREERPDRGDRGDRGDRRERKRSATPPRRKEPTPDLTDVPSILERKRRLTQWDIKPPGYENVTAEQAKLSGMFPLPGAPRQQPMDPSRLQAFMSQPGGSAESTALKPSNSRQSKRLFVYNIPPTATGESVMSFFNLQLNGLNVIHSVDPCISAQIADDRSFALLEFKSPNDATVALAFDGITMAESGDKGLEVRRPKDYIVPGTAEQEYQEGTLLNEVPDSPNKICVSNIPAYIPEEPVTMLLKSFGELKSFVLVKDASTEESRVSISVMIFSSSQLTSHRASPFVSTSTPRPLALPWRASTVWNWVTATSRSPALVLALLRRRDWTWASTPCQCSPRPRPRTWRLAVSCSS